MCSVHIHPIFFGRSRPAFGERSLVTFNLFVQAIQKCERVQSLRQWSEADVKLFLLNTKHKTSFFGSSEFSVKFTESFFQKF